jgi:hypothetical protein
LATKKKITNQAPQEVAFDYIKSNHFRVIRVDGAIGGLTAHAVIHMDLFSERPAIPKQIVMGVSRGEMGGEVRREGRKAWIREVEVGATLDLPTAMSLHAWLGDKIAALQTAYERASKRQRPNNSKLKTNGSRGKRDGNAV